MGLLADDIDQVTSPRWCVCHHVVSSQVVLEVSVVEKVGVAIVVIVRLNILHQTCTRMVVITEIGGEDEEVEEEEEEEEEEEMVVEVNNTLAN